MKLPINQGRNASGRIAAQARYSSTVELAAIGISHVALDGRFLHANKALVDMLRYSERELKGKTVKDISRPDEIGEVFRRRARIGFEPAT